MLTKNFLRGHTWVTQFWEKVQEITEKPVSTSSHMYYSPTCQSRKKIQIFTRPNISTTALYQIWSCFTQWTENHLKTSSLCPPWGNATVAWQSVKILLTNFSWKRPTTSWDHCQFSLKTCYTVRKIKSSSIWTDYNSVHVYSSWLCASGKFIDIASSMQLHYSESESLTTVWNSSFKPAVLTEQLGH